MKLYIKASHQNRLDEEILMDDRMNSSIKKTKRKMLDIYINLFNNQESWYIMTAKIEIRQYAIFTKPRKSDTADIRCFTFRHLNPVYVCVYVKKINNLKHAFTQLRHQAMV